MQVLPGLDVRLDHLRRMTGGHGIWQHTVGSTPAEAHGFCTDDNARALIALMRSSDVLLDDPDRLRCEALSFLHLIVAAFNQDAGRFKNFMSSDGRWLEEVGSADCHGRAVWALGEAWRAGLNRQLVEDVVAAALPGLEEIDYPRSLSYAVLGLHACTTFDDGSEHQSRLQRSYRSIAARLRLMVDQVCDEEWPWVEDRLTYANALIAEALVIAGSDLQDRQMFDFGLHALEWLVTIQQDSNARFAPIGSDSWYVRGGIRSRYTQQPIEAATTSDACISAFRQTGQLVWLRRAESCLQWFAGANDHSVAMIDPETWGSYDGLHQFGVNRNQGAESTIVWIIAGLNYIRATWHVAVSQGCGQMVGAEDRLKGGNPNEQ